MPEVSAPNPATDESRREEIAQRFLEQDYEGTLDGFERYLADYPRDEMAWTIVGNAYRELDRVDEAERAYDRALHLNPRYVDALNHKGIVHRIRGEYDLAMSCYEGVLALQPDHAQAYSSMSVIALKRYHDKDALAWARRAYELNSEDPVILSNLAVVCHYAGNAGERDRFAALAARKGYPRMENLRKIFEGEMPLRD